MPPALRRLGALLALLAAAPALAQTATLNGFVRDAQTGETLVQATVLVEGTGRGGTTNTQGYYTVGDLAPGAYAVAVSYVGYDRARREVVLEPGQTLRLDVELAPQELGGGEVVVEAEEPIEEDRAVGVQNVPVRLVQDLPTVFEPDLFRSIQLLPGVKAASDFSSGLYVRGGSPDQNLILLDGTTVYNPTHFFGFFSTFNTEAIKDARLYKGAYPSQYGGRLGAVLDVQNRDGNRNRTAGHLQLGLLASRAGIEGPLAGGRGSYLVAARRSTLEPLLAVLREQLDDEGIPESFHFYDVNAKVGLDLTPDDRVSLSGYAGRDRVAVPFGDASRFQLDFGNRTATLGYSRVLSGSAFATARATASHYFSEPVGTVAETEFRRPNTITDLSGRLDVEWLPGERFEGRAGVWGGYFDLRLKSEFNGAVGVDFRSPAGYGSGYAQARVRPPGGWIVTAGARADYFRSLTDDEADADAGATAGYLRLSPQVQVERLFGDDVVVQAAVGRYHQFLTLISNEAFSGFDTWLTTGVGVPPQASEQAVVGVKTRLGGAYRLDIEVYGRTLRELFDMRPGIQDVSGLSYVELFRFGEGHAYGVEVLLEKGAGRLTGLLGYTLSTTRRRYPAEPAFSRTFPPKYDRLHDLTAVLSYGLGRGWKATAVGAYATGQAYTAPDQRYRVGGFPFNDGGLDGLYSARLNAARLPAYHRVDVGVAKEGRLVGADAELQLQLVNVYSRRNAWFVAYDFDENPVGLDTVRQLPILPNVSLALRW